MRIYLEIFAIWILIGVIFAIPQIIDYYKSHNNNALYLIKRRQKIAIAPLVGIYLSFFLGGEEPTLNCSYTVLIIAVYAIIFALDKRKTAKNV